MRGKFNFRDGFTYRMPVHFRGWPFSRDTRVVYSDVLMMQTEQSTDMEALAQYVPSEFEILRPSVVWGYANCRGVDFMANGEYRIFQASVPVRYIGGEREIEGVYPLVIWEDDTVPILGGREEDGMPKVFCDISSDRHFEKHWFASASLYCETMARFDFYEVCEADAETLKAAQDSPFVNNFGYRYIPLVESGGAATCGPILYPQEVHPRKIWNGDASVDIVVPKDWYKIPQMYSTLKCLGGLPNLGFTNGVRMEGSLRLCVADSKSL
ncbi:MAG: acetoacetate decarboxylase family protein [Synergistaceae bacterium]|nr:acetoacetate decarboxylase family protein [Synergistaceae bacterium]